MPVASLFFVTPAWQRLELSRICFAQRAAAIERLADFGIEARCVVVADDENLELAREFGFDTVERDNDWLGRRFNDGYEHAAKQGADYVCPVGSDTWLDPETLAPLVLSEARAIRASRSYTLVRRDGLALAEYRLAGLYGYGSWVMPTALLAGTGYRPCREEIAKGCDRSAFAAIGATFEEHESHPLAAVGFRSEVQITPYGAYLRRHGGQEYRRPFERLADRYPADLVAAAARFYGHEISARREPASVSVAIMAHPSRERFLAYLLDRLDADPQVVWDAKNDRWETGRRALLAFDEAATHHLVVQDDALVPRDLVAGVARMLAFVTAGSPVGLYLGRARPRGSLVTASVREADASNAAFVVGPGPWWGVGICIPTETIPELVEWADRRRDMPQYDLRITGFFQERDVPCFYTMPSLVEHRTEDNPSLVRGRGAGNGRRAHRFVGEMASALEPAWNRGIIRMRDLRPNAHSSHAVYVLNESDRVVSRAGLVFPPGEEKAIVLNGPKLREVRACRALRIY